MFFLAGAAAVLKTHGGLRITLSQEYSRLWTRQWGWLTWASRHSGQGGEYHQHTPELHITGALSNSISVYQLSSNLTSSPIRMLYRQGPGSQTRTSTYEHGPDDYLTHFHDHSQRHEITTIRAVIADIPRHCSSLIPPELCYHRRQEPSLAAATILFWSHDGVGVVVVASVGFLHPTELCCHHLLSLRTVMTTKSIAKQFQPGHI